MLRTMPRTMSLSVKGAAGVGDVSVGINVDTADVPPGVGVGLDPVFVEAEKREQPLRISNVQHKMNIVICGRGRWRMCCLSSRLLCTPTCNYVLNGCVEETTHPPAS